MSEHKQPDSGHFNAAYSLKSGEETQRHYSSWAATYDREVGEENGYAQPHRAAEMLHRFQPTVTTAILDAGCGSGLSGQALRAIGYDSIDGCDFSPEMLKRCADKKCYRNLFEADLNKGQPTIADSTYDAITCVGVF